MHIQTLRVFHTRYNLENVAWILCIKIFQHNKSAYLDLQALKPLNQLEPINTKFYNKVK